MVSGITIIIVVLILLIVFAAYNERKDLNRPEGKQAQPDCKGMECSYYQSEPSKADRTDVLLQKIEHAAAAEHDAIKWRRSLIVAVVTSLVGQLLMCGGTVDGKNFLIQTLVTFTISYMVQDYYSYHVYDYPLRVQIPKATSILAARL